MPPVKPKLVIIEGKEKGKVIPLKDGTAVIGRSKGDVLVQDARISRSHVAVHFDEKKGRLSFTDLKSLNGTMVNGQPAESGELLDGDKLQLGNTLFDCQLSGAVETVKPVEVAPPAAAPKAPTPAPDVDLYDAPEKGSEPVASPLSKMDDWDHGNDRHEQQLDAPPPPRRRAESSDDEGTSAKLKKFLPKKYLAIGPRGRMVTLGVVGVVGIYFLLFAKGGNQNLERELGSVELLQSSGKLDEAIGKAEEIRKAHPENSQIYMALGALYVQHRKVDAAIAAYRRARELKPVQPLIPVRLIPLYLRAGFAKDADEEMQKLDQMLREGKHSKELFVEAAQLFLDFKDLKQAPEKTLILSRALQTEFAPQSTIGYKLEAQVLFQMGKNQDATHALEKALELDPKDEWLLENLAFAKLSMKDLPGATEIVENWIRERPTAVKALLVMGYLKYNDKAYAQALPYVKKIVEITAGGQADPLYPEAMNLGGQIYWQLAQTKEAITFLKQACELGFTQSCEHEALRVAPPATAAVLAPPAPTKPAQATRPAPRPPARNKASKRR